MILEAGSTIGKVRLERKLGEGANGIVWKGRHTTLGIDVAVKVLLIDRAQRSDDVYQERFRREAQIAARLSHPCIVRVIDFGDHEGLPYLVMDFVDGFTLNDYLERRGGALEEKTVLKVVVAVASALHVAHEAGIVHRDLKPANILLDKRGQLKLADLGLARDDNSAQLTRDKLTVGTPAYMAPEALTPGAKTDHRVDLYALGVIAYRMAFGRRPFDGSLQQIIAGHLTGKVNFALPTQCRPEIVALIRRLMTYNQNERTQTAAEVVRDAKALLHQEGGVSSLSQASGSGASGERSPTGVGGQSQSLGRSVEFKSVVNFLERRFSEHTTERGGGTITHSTARERFLVWCTLAAVVVIACVGYWKFGS